MSKIDLSGKNHSVVDFLGKEWKFNCMGCAIATKELEVPGGIIYDGKYNYLVNDAQIPVPGFLIINCLRHVKSYSDLTEEERNEISDILYYTEKALKELKIADEITIVQEERAPHFHIWIVPNYDWMNEKFGKGVTYLRDIADYAKNNATKADVENCLKVSENVKEYLKNCNIR